MKREILGTPTRNSTKDQHQGQSTKDQHQGQSQDSGLISIWQIQVSFCTLV